METFSRLPLAFALLAGLLAAPVTAPAVAAEAIAIVEAPEEIVAKDHANRVDFAWGVAVTSNYISSGQTQSGDDPAVQAYFEISSGLVYAGIWLSSVELDTDSVEFDLSWGIRQEYGPLKVDLGYVRYVYDDTGDCCGEWVAKVELDVSPFTVSGMLEFDPQTSGTTLTGGLAYRMAEAWSISGEIEEDLVGRDTSWNAGLTWQATDTLSLDLRYHGSEQFPDRYVATLAYDFSTAE